MNPASLLGSSVRWGIRTIFGTLASRLPHGPHIMRYSMYSRIHEKLGDTSWRDEQRCLSVSGSRFLCELIGLQDRQITEVSYPDHSLLDMRQFGDNTFDIVVSDQVLEHLEGDPQKAFSETYRLLVPGGIALHTTCFTNEIHWGPEDYWRFTPDALAYLARDFSEVIDAGGWGNRLTWVLDWAGLRMFPVPHAQWHPLHKVATFNEPAWPIVTWVIARK
jgi:SAM-dependent methyltransferase